VQVTRLERYCRRAKNAVWEGEREDLINAMADVAEAAEISRRLWQQLKDYLGELPVQL
jgi:hypothetical protein